MRWLMMTAVMMTTAVPTSAAGQTLGDTFNQLRSTLRQLGGGTPRQDPRPATPPPTAPVRGAPTEGGDDGAMVPASVVVDDPSDTTLAARAAAVRRVETFDIRSFKLGMSPREAGRVGELGRFRRRWNSILQTTGTFEVEAARLANQQLNRPIERSSKVQLQKVQAFDPDGNEVNLEFTLEPQGPRLSRMTYNARLAGTTPRQASDALVARYGRPTTGRVEDGQLTWRNSDRPYDPATPSLGAIVGENDMMLFLQQSTGYTQAAYRRRTSRAAELAAGRGGGVRF